MSVPNPVVRYLIACDEILVATNNPRKVSLVNVVSSIRSYSSLPFPVTHPLLCVYLQLTEGRGGGDIHIEIVQAVTGQPIIRTQARPVRFTADPLDVVGLAFRVKNCTFPAAGQYEVHCWYNNVMLAEQPLLLR